MSDRTNEDALENRHYVSLVLRLTLDRKGQLVRGELVDTTDTFRQWFTTLADLNQALEAWLIQQAQAQESTEI